MKKIIIKLLALTCAISIFFSTYIAIIYIAQVKLTIDDNLHYQTMKGFGASSAWTFQKLGLRGEELIDEAIEMLYGDSGLSLNIYRYNIGAGSKDSQLDNIAPYNNGWFSPDRRADSFFIAENYIDKDSFKDINNYDFSRDNASQIMLNRVLDTGNISEIVFFSNSPHYLMTHSGVATGEYEYQNNLKEDFYEAYCDYLLIIVKYFYDNILSSLDTVPDIYISPINEPQWKWGGEGASQEGCHFDPEPLAQFVDVFIREVKSFNQIHEMNIIADVFDSGNYKLSKIKDYLNAMSKYDYFNELGHISVHSYGVDAKKSHRRRFIRLMDKKYSHLSLSMTEYCLMEHGRDNSIESGLHTGQVMLRDLSILNVTDWSWWLAVSDGDYNDGLVYWDDDMLSVLRRYYVVGHFTKYINKGDVRVAVKSSDLLNISSIDSVAFLKPDGSKILVLINSGKPQTIKLDEKHSISRMIISDAENNWTDKEHSSNTIKLPKDSITTIIID